MQLWEIFAAIGVAIWIGVTALAYLLCVRSGQISRIERRMRDYVERER